MDWAGRFAFDRGAGSEGERHAGEIVAGELNRLGLRVERVEVAAARLPAAALPWLGWLGVGVWSVGLEIATLLGDPWPVRLALALLALLWLRLTTVEGLGAGLGRIRRSRVSTLNVIAWRPVDGEPPPLCVVFHTSLETFDPGRELVPRWLSTRALAVLVGGQVFFDLTVNRNPLGLPGARLAGLLCGMFLWLAIGLRIERLVRSHGRPDVRDNRTGLAMLLELARTWPRGTDSRIEARFVTTGGRTLDRAGLRKLLRAIAHEWPPRPSLVVDWLAPGIGPGLTLAEQGTGPLAKKAATDLWIPHRLAHRAAIAREHRPMGRGGPCYVGMVGSGVATRRRSAAAPAIEPDALGRAAQLATEIALRWAKQCSCPQSS
jgi:hypothetical protein